MNFDLMRAVNAIEKSYYEVECRLNLEKSNVHNNLKQGGFIETKSPTPKHCKFFQSRIYIV